MVQQNDNRKLVDNLINYHREKDKLKTMKNNLFYGTKIKKNEENKSVL